MMGPKRVKQIATRLKEEALMEPGVVMTEDDDRGICGRLQTVTGWIAGTRSGTDEFIGTQRPSMLEHH